MGFPPRASSMASAASDPLNGPPPSPQAVGAGPTGSPTPFSLSAVAPPVAPDQMPADMLNAIINSAQTIGTMLDSYAQAIPALAPDFANVKDQLQAVLAQLLAAGAGATSPTATGQQFPAAFDRGTAGAGAV
jgi:hypothetical protein